MIKTESKYDVIGTVRGGQVLWANYCGWPVSDIHVLSAFMRTAICGRT